MSDMTGVEGGTTTEQEGAEGASGSEGAEETQGTTQGGGQNELLDEFRTFRGDMLSRFEGLEGRLPQQQTTEGEGEGEGEEEGLEELDLSQFSDDDFTDDGALTPEAQRRALQQMIQRGVAEALRPEQERAAQERRDEYADMLEEQYPELQDPKVQDAMLTKTRAYAESLGQPKLAQDPQLLEMVYLAEKMRERQGNEVPAGSQQGVTLERGGPAGPAAQRNQEDDGDRIVKLAKSSHFRLGSG